MNNENYEYLKDQLTKTGFSGVVEQLKGQMEKGQIDFQLTHHIKYGEKEMNYALNFRKSNERDMYFFNSYTAGLSGGKEYVSNTFFVDQRITAKEAFNLLDGRAVEKKYNHHEKIGEGDKAVYKPIKDSTYTQWVKMDFNDVDEHGNFKRSTFGEKWGFDLEEKLSGLPIRQLKDETSKAELLASLKKGNLHSVTFEKDGIAETRYIEANPRTRTINVYDKNMELIKDQKAVKDIASDNKEKKEQKISTDQDSEDEEGPAKKRTKKRIAR